jgi:hypothetical protein
MKSSMKIVGNVARMWTEYLFSIILERYSYIKHLISILSLFKGI